MLTPLYLTEFPEPLFKLYQEFEDNILADIARRIAKTGKITDTAQWQMERLKAVGATDEFIKKEIAKINKQSEKQIEQMINEAAQISYGAEAKIYTSARKYVGEITEHPELQMIINAMVKQTQGELKNLTRSLGIAQIVNGKTKTVDLTTSYQKELDLAQLSISTGTLDYNTAVRIAVKGLADSGIRFIDYESGWVNHLDVAARRAVMTGVNQMSVKMTDRLAESMDCEFFEVTAHAGARPSHRDWQGGIYHRGGAKDGYQDLEETTGLGSVDGLCGANCRHSYNPFFPGISVRAYSDYHLHNIDPPDFTYNGKTYTAYEATQQQRAIETAIRKTKRQLNCYDAAGLQDDYTAAAIKLNRQREAYNDFSNAAGLLKQKELTQVYGFSHSPASKAVWANKKEVEKTVKGAILSDKEEAAILSYTSGGSYVLNAKLRDGIALENYEKELMLNIDSALDKLPVYKGLVLRDVEFKDKELLREFAKNHKIGDIVEYPAFTSSSTLNLYQENPTFRLYIKSKNGVDLRKHNGEEGEILFKRNAKFTINNVYREEKIIIIEMEEL